MRYELKNFEIIEKIGEGTYGMVYKTINLVTNELAALKEIKCCNEIDGIAPTTLREISTLKELQHINIVRMYQTFTDKGKVFMVFEYLDTDLYKYMKENGDALEPSLVKRFSYQIMQGLLFCHTRGYIHRDLKPQNLLIDTKNTIIKIADFGLARKYNAPVKQFTHEVVTLWYRAPEILLNMKRYSCAIDVWAVACIIVEMTAGVPLFEGDSEIDQLFSIFKILGTLNNEIWPNLDSLSGWNPAFPVWHYNLGTYLKDCVDDQCLDLLEKMLIYYPAYRISIRDALLHEWFHDIDKSTLPAIDEERKSCPKTSFIFYQQQSID